MSDLGTACHEKLNGFLTLIVIRSDPQIHFSVIDQKIQDLITTALVNPPED